MSGAKKLFKAVEASAGGGGASGNVIENVFSDQLYLGTGASLTINNGIDLSGSNEGLVWLRRRKTSGEYSSVYDTIRGPQKQLRFGDSQVEATQTGNNGLTSFNSNGFTISNGPIGINYGGGYGGAYQSLTFKKANNFFHVSTVVADAGTPNPTVDLSALGTVGMIWVKPKDLAQQFMCWHKDLSANHVIDLSASNVQERSSGNPFITISGTTLTITSGTASNYGTYIIYAWADNSTIASENQLVRCGTYTGNNSNNLIDLGFEPEFLIGKAINTNSSWYQFDQSSGWTGYGYSSVKNPFSNNTEQSANAPIQLCSTGFNCTNSDVEYNYQSEKYIYMAIRRAPMRATTDATNIYQSLQPSGSGATAVSFRPDFAFEGLNSSGSVRFHARSINTKQLTDTNSGDSSTTKTIHYDYAGVTNGHSLSGFGFLGDVTGSRQVAVWQNQRGVCDLVNFRVGSSLISSVRHNLNVVPEIVIYRCQTATSNWGVAGSVLGTNKFLNLNNNNALGTATISANTSTHISLGGNDFGGIANHSYSAICFASQSGVSKVGTFSHTTGSTTSVSVNGFTSGVRFLMLKRTDGTGNWYWFNSAVGIASGGESYKLFDLSQSLASADLIDNGTDTFIAQSDLATGDYFFIAMA